MTFEQGNRWLLTSVTSRYENNLHQKIVGRLCELVSFVENEFGWFNVLLDDGMHSVCTSIVHRVSEDDGTVTVETANSVYTFAMVCFTMQEDACGDAVLSYTAEGVRVSMEKMGDPCR